MLFTKNARLVRQVAATFNIRRQCASVYQRAGCSHLSRAIAQKSSAYKSPSPLLADSCGRPKSIVKTTIHEELLEVLEAQTFYLYDPASMDVLSIRLNKYSEMLSGCMEIDDGKDICFLSLPEGSLNHQENLLKEYTHYSKLRRITIEFKEGIEPQQVLLQAYPLGRIRITTQEPKVRTQWVVFFDSQKNLWAMEADDIDTSEDDPEDPDVYLPPGDDEYDFCENLFGDGIRVVKLGTISQLKDRLVRKSPMPFTTISGVERWVSTRDYLVYATSPPT